MLFARFSGPSQAGGLGEQRVSDHAAHKRAQNVCAPSETPQASSGIMQQIIVLKQNFQCITGITNANSMEKQN